MKISDPKKLLLFTLIILAANSIIGYAIFESYHKQLNSARLVQHTEQTIYLTAGLLTLARDMVTSTHAYVITRNNFFLESIDTVEKTTVEHLQQLTILSEGYHPEQQLAEGVQRTMQELGLLCRHLVAQSTVEKVSAPIFPASLYELPALKAIQDEEANLLKQRIITNNLLLAQFNRFSLVMFILMIFFTVLPVAVTWNYLNQHKDKNQWAGELIVANEELAHHDKEKEMRAAELIIANHELAFQNDEKEKRAAELIIANRELAFQNDEKEKRAAELIVANQELAFQNDEKEKRAQELVIANSELAFQNDEKEKRAAELIVANRELAFQNDEKEKRASELLLANQELEAFAYVSSHDLQEPLRKIQTFSNRILETEYQNLSERGKDYFGRMQSTASRMQQLIDDLLGFSRLNVAEREFENTALIKIVDEVAYGLKESIDEKQAVIETGELGSAVVIPFQFRQLMHNLISNALKFSNPRLIPHIKIESTFTDNTAFLDKTGSRIRYHQISVCDNGIGFNLLYKDRIFEVFQKLHGKHEYPGTGIGLAIVKKIVENHNGHITVTSKLDLGTTFNIYIPCFLAEDFPALQTISNIA